MLAISQDNIAEIENLSSLGYGSKEIALVLDVKPTLFAVLCQDEETDIGKAYLRGVLKIEREKRETLVDTFSSSETALTAIQIHDNHAKKQAYLDVKNDVYSDFDFEE